MKELILLLMLFLPMKLFAEETSVEVESYIKYWVDLDPVIEKQLDRIESKLDYLMNYTYVGGGKRLLYFWKLEQSGKREKKNDE